MASDLFNPYPPGDPRHAEHRARFERMVDAALAFAGESERLDDQVAPLVASALSGALDADPHCRVFDGRIDALRGLVVRLTCPRCLPVPEHVQLAARTLQKILAYWDGEGLEDDDD